MIKTELVNIFASSYDIYIDSPANGTDPRKLAPGEYGFLGNPFADEDNGREKFQEYFVKRLNSDVYFKRAVLSMYGKRLGCLSDPGDSHGQAILKWLNSQQKAYTKVFGPFNTKRF